MTTGSRGRATRSCGRGRMRVSTDPRTAQSLLFTPITPSTPLTSQVGPVDQQFILAPNPRTTWFFLLHLLCSLQLQRQSSHWVIPLMHPNQMLLHHRLHTDEDLALWHSEVYTKQ
ncbi:uncharacterized protein LOC110267962 [Arachis ipaensis]|uniref:uncharacterized protein LOC110267962 n=1 Tax=Arachis ipaensis TaxID=130454 RepID=UPI000A2AF76E|nr:uncharacterized protein LOC110267962 [Arachis ipaensis]QHO24718.1 uncharacterized protein DS421_12g374670 [Arachis hypogaea]